MFDNKKIGERIKELRKKKGMSQQELGETIGLSQNAISKIEIGQTQLTLEHLYNIANTFDVSPDYICMGIDESTILQMLQKYISMKCIKTSEGNETLTYPTLIIDKVFLEYLVQIAKINSQKMPEAVRELWREKIVGDFYNKNKDNTFEDYTTVIPLPKYLLSFDDLKSNITRLDLLRDSYYELFETCNHSQ